MTESLKLRLTNEELNRQNQLPLHQRRKVFADLDRAWLNGNVTPQPLWIAGRIGFVAPDGGMELLALPPENAKSLTLTPAELRLLAMACCAEENLGKEGLTVKTLNYLKALNTFVSQHPGLVAEDPSFGKFIDENRPGTAQDWKKLEREIQGWVVTEKKFYKRGLQNSRAWDDQI